MKQFSRKFARFSRDTAGSVTTEAVLVLPFLIWAFCATFSFFDVYRAKNLSLKANYAVSDLLSRETNPIDAKYVYGLEEIYQYLTQGTEDTWLRVTVIYCSADCGLPERELRQDWSFATDGLAIHSDEDIMEHYEKIIPVIPSGERVIMVETSIEYDPPFPENLTGVGERTMTDIVMTRPRFAPQLLFRGINA